MSVCQGRACDRGLAHLVVAQLGFELSAVPVEALVDDLAVAEGLHHAVAHEHVADVGRRCCVRGVSSMYLELCEDSVVACCDGSGGTTEYEAVC